MINHMQKKSEWF